MSLDKSLKTKAALERFKTILKVYPDVGVHYKAIQYIALCENQLGEHTSGAQ